MKNFLIAFVILAIAISFYKYQKAKENAKIEDAKNLSDEELEDLCLNKYNKAACTVRGTRFIKGNK
ncbi:hypothetical protein CUREO4125_01965 [Campylobacter ureolyticus]|uniref:hypothetical protein n=1 Tax=Campylobacter ureolyticus TaxID=827 RepID=UPI00215B1FC0|nr:hypothetical protein [Campylobacter ureolyticus]MCR8699153.1 hypothetical protein [Campylobacter ureolyticus]